MATEGLDEYNAALGSPVPDVTPEPMSLGIAISGDKYYELHVRTGGKYFIERGEFGKDTVVKARGAGPVTGTPPKICPSPLKRPVCWPRVPCAPRGTGVLWPQV